MLRKVVIAVIVLGLIIAGVIAYRSTNRVEPQVTLGNALKKTAESTTYRYSITQQMTVDGSNKLFAKIDGEKNKQNAHIKGSMYGSEVDIYQVGDTLYQLDPFSKKWMTVKGAPPAAQEVFMVELNPLSSFNFKDIGEVKYLGKQKINGQNTLAFEVKPSIQNQLMETLWTDFTYTLYVNSRNNLLVKGVLYAKSKVKAENVLTMTTDFKDFGQGIEINPPVK